MHAREQTMDDGARGSTRACMACMLRRDWNQEAHTLALWGRASSSRGRRGQGRDQVARACKAITISFSVAHSVAHRVHAQGQSAAATTRQVNHIAMPEDVADSSTRGRFA